MARLLRIAATVWTRRKRRLSTKFRPRQEAGREDDWQVLYHNKIGFDLTDISKETVQLASTEGLPLWAWLVLAPDQWQRQEDMLMTTIQQSTTGK